MAKTLNNAVAKSYTGAIATTRKVTFWIFFPLNPFSPYFFLFAGYLCISAKSWSAKLKRLFERHIKISHMIFKLQVLVVVSFYSFFSSVAETFWSGFETFLDLQNDQKDYPNDCCLYIKIPSKLFKINVGYCVEFYYCSWQCCGFKKTFWSGSCFIFWSDKMFIYGHDLQYILPIIEKTFLLNFKGFFIACLIGHPSIFETAKQVA
jgi:hypothetical protein